MEKRKSFVFYGINHEIQLLSKILNTQGIEHEIQTCAGGLTIATSIENYLKCLEAGTNIILIKKNNFESIEWIDKFRELKPIGYLPVMRCNLSETYCFPEIKDFCDKLKQYTGCDVLTNFGEVDYDIEIMLEVDLNHYGWALNECKLFNNNIVKASPFYEIVYCEKDKNSACFSMKNTQKSLENLFFYIGLTNPEGIYFNSINDEAINNKETKTCGKIIDFNIDLYNEDDRERKIIGNYTAKYFKQFEDPLNKNKSKIYEIKDDGDFQCKIVRSTFNEIFIETKININRCEISYYSSDQKALSDIDQSDQNFTFKIIEYFKRNKDIVIHYSNACDAVEIYRLPEIFKIENVLNRDITGDPIIYADVIQLIEEDDYETIKTLINDNINNQKSRKRVYLN